MNGIIRKMMCGLLVSLSAPAALLAQGFALPGAGPVNRSIGGAATAAPLDATGALHWNPATISALPNSIDIGVEMISARHENSSFVAADAFGPGVPAADMKGHTRAQNGFTPLPAIALVYQKPDSPVSMGLLLNGIGGFFVNFKADPGNPVFSPPASPDVPDGFGFGSAYARLGLIQMAPTLAYRITERLSVGVAPTVTIADLQAAPAGVFAPDDANGDGFASFPDATNARVRWGMGVQGGVYYETDFDVNLGASIKSPQWFEKFDFNGSDELGRPRDLTLHMSYPMIVSLGASYTGLERLLLAADVRWVDYATTKLWGESAGFAPDGRITGLGWDTVFSVSLGAQYRMNEMMRLRIGYTFNENPIKGDDIFYNIQAPGTFQHTLGLGATMQMTEQISMHLAYVHGFKNQVTGPFQSPDGPVAGTSITDTIELDSLVTGLTVAY